MSYQGNQPYANASGQFIPLGQGDERYARLAESNVWERHQTFKRGLEFDRAYQGNVSDYGNSENARLLANAYNYRNIRSLTGSSAGPTVLEGLWGGSMVFASQGNSANEGFQFLFRSSGDASSNYDTVLCDLSYDKFTYKGHKVWHAGNMGPGSGMNADTVDGYHAQSNFRDESDSLMRVGAFGLGVGKYPGASNAYVSINIDNPELPTGIYPLNTDSCTGTFPPGVNKYLALFVFGRGNGYRAQELRDTISGRAYFRIFTGQVGPWVEYWHSGNDTPLLRNDENGEVDTDNAVPFSLLRRSSSDNVSLRFRRIDNSGVERLNVFLGFFENSFRLGTNPDLSSAYKVWHSGQQGPSSGMDSDTVDGYHLNDIIRRITHTFGGTNPEDPDTTKLPLILSNSSATPNSVIGGKSYWFIETKTYENAEDRRVQTATKYVDGDARYYRSAQNGNPYGPWIRLLDSQQVQTSVIDDSAGALLSFQGKGRGPFGLGGSAATGMELGMSGFSRDRDPGIASSVNAAIECHYDGNYGFRLAWSRSNGTKLYIQGNERGLTNLYRLWSEADQGPGTGMDADTVDGIEGSRIVVKDVANQAIRAPLKISGTNDGAANTAFLEFLASNGARTGYVGDGTKNNSDITLRADSGRVEISDSSGSGYAWHEGNLKVQSSVTDATPGAVMRVGAFGLGGPNDIGYTNIDTVYETGFYTTIKDDNGTFPSGTTSRFFSVINISGYGSSRRFQIGFGPSGGIWTRYHTTSWSNWTPIWTSTSDGSGSGLDADTLDGLDSNDLVKKTGDEFSGTLKYIASDRTEPAIYVHGGQSDTSILRVNDDPNSSTFDYGYNLFYQGTGGGNHNCLILESSSNVQGQGNLAFKVYRNGLVEFGSTPRVNSNNVWHEGNDGPGTGMDADTVDGKHADDFLLKTGGTLSGPLRINYGNFGTSDSGTLFLGYGDRAAFRNDEAAEVIRFESRSTNSDPFTTAGYWHRFNFGLVWGDPAGGSLGFGAINAKRIAVEGNDVWHSGNKKIQSSTTDTTNGALMPVGAFGLGNVNPVDATDLNTRLPTGMYTVRYDARNKPSPWNGGTLFQITRETGVVSQILVDLDGTFWSRVSYNDEFENWSRHWSSQDQGPGSGMDADTVDGIEGEAIRLKADHILDTNARAHDDVISDYPLGTSVMYVRSASGWPSQAGTVVTVRPAENNLGYQEYTNGTGDNGETAHFQRTRIFYTSSGVWGGWQETITEASHATTSSHGIVRRASDFAARQGTNTELYVTPSQIPVHKKSGQLNFADSNILQMSHGMNRPPDRAWAQLICVTANRNYRPGQVVDNWRIYDNAGSAGPPLVVSDHAYVEFICGDHTAQVLWYERTAAADWVDINRSNWRIILHGEWLPQG